jgi:hypothetical protein
MLRFITCGLQNLYSLFPAINFLFIVEYDLEIVVSSFSQHFYRHGFVIHMKHLLFLLAMLVYSYIG